MPEPESGPSAIDERWLLSNVPFVSYYCENDPQYTMRFVAGVDNRAFGYVLSEFVDNRKYFAASANHPEDQDVLDELAEQAVAGCTPAIGRYRVVDADAREALVLTVAKSVVNAQGQWHGFAGCTIDITGYPELHGPSGVLSEMRSPLRRRPPADRPAEFTARWVASQLPMLLFFTENDPGYTARHISGSLEELIGYSAEEFVSGGGYMPSSTVLPQDHDVADACLEDAASKVDCRAAARVRVLDADGREVPVLVFVRGARPADGGAVGVAGGVLDIRHAPSLQGRIELLGG